MLVAIFCNHDNRISQSISNIALNHSSNQIIQRKSCIITFNCGILNARPSLSDDSSTETSKFYVLFCGISYSSLDTKPTS